MDAEDLALNDGPDAKVVEDLSAVLPWIGVAVLSDSFVVKAIDCRNLSCLVVSSQQGDVSRVL